MDGGRPDRGDGMSVAEEADGNTGDMRSEALKFFRHVFGGQRGILAVWTAKRIGKDMNEERTRFFEYPSKAEEVLSHALEESEAGREAYFCAHLLTGRRRVKENAGEVAALWGDLDGAEIPNGSLAPTVVVESSPGRWHCYWRLSDALPPEVAEGLNKRLARKIGADPSGFDLTQLLRVPGTVNHKYEERPVVKVFSLDAGRSHSPAELDETLPEIEERRRNGERSPLSGEPPVMLGEAGTKVWNGENPKIRDGRLDRSGSLVKIGRVLYDAGANRDVIERALEERDGSLGWNKYTSRRDAAERYGEIVDELEESGRNSEARITVGKAAGGGRSKPGEDGREGEEEDSEGEEEKHPTQAERLIRLAGDAKLFHTPSGESFAAIPVSSHVETHPVKSRGFRQFLVRRFYEECGKPPGSQAMQDALGLLEARAQFDGPEREVHVRVAGSGAGETRRIYLDLANEAWEVVEVSADGWRVLSAGDAPVSFRRARGMLALPTPRRTGEAADDILRRSINIEDTDAMRLAVAWLVQCLNPSGPYPVLIFQGEQGSAKSTAERLLKTLVDPSTAPLRTTPRNEHDLYIAADSSHAVALDNISTIPPWLSDALCRLSTGGGFSTRTLYENREQELFEGTRPIILNGISDVATRPDLLDRALVISLPRIPEERRQPEAELWKDFERTRPALLGKLLDAASGALKTLPSLRLERMPRMADFALWATAAEDALGWERGSFMSAYEGNRTQATESALDADPVGGAVAKFMESRDEWTGATSDLWAKLGEIAGDDVKRTKAWPGAPNALSNRMKRLAPALRDVGIEYVENPDSKRTKALKKIAVKDRHHRNHRHSEEKDLQNGTFFDDDPHDDDSSNDDKTVIDDDPANDHRHHKTPANEGFNDDDDGNDDDLRMFSKERGDGREERRGKRFTI